jgi:hypothetical protein
VSPAQPSQPWSPHAKAAPPQVAAAADAAAALEQVPDAAISGCSCVGAAVGVFFSSVAPALAHSGVNDDATLPTCTRESGAAAGDPGWAVTIGHPIRAHRPLKSLPAAAPCGRDGAAVRRPGPPRQTHIMCREGCATTQKSEIGALRCAVTARAQHRYEGCTSHNSRAARCLPPGAADAGCCMRATHQGAPRVSK